MRLYSVILLSFVSFLLYAANSMEKEQIQERIKPIGKVTIENADKTAVILNTGKTEKSSGKGIYEQHCIVCHRDGLAGAPKLQNESDWKSRLVGKTLNDLVVSATKGLNAMPAKGTCVECTDADLNAAIEYMIEHHE